MIKIKAKIEYEYTIPEEAYRIGDDSSPPQFRSLEWIKQNEEKVLTEIITGDVACDVENVEYKVEVEAEKIE